MSVVGTQSLHTNSYDEALGLPTEERCATVALRTQQIIAEESGGKSVVDPLGGSHLVEMLTEEIAKSPSKKFLKLRKMGGSMHAIEAGYQQTRNSRNGMVILTKVELGEIDCRNKLRGLR